MNIVTLIGRLTADPELKFFSSGTAISKFSVAIDRSYKKDNQTVTDFIPIEVWGKKAEYCATCFQKGYLIAINGSLHIDRYTDTNGDNKFFAKVIANSVVKLNTPNKSNDGDESDTSNSDVDNNTTSGGDNTSNTGNGSDAGNNNGNDNSTAQNVSDNSGASSSPTSNFQQCADDDEIPF